jgi:hypothetical protein
LTDDLQAFLGDSASSHVLPKIAVDKTADEPMPEEDPFPVLKAEPEVSPLPCSSRSDR